MNTMLYRKIDDKLLGDWHSLWEKSNFANFTNSPYWFLSVLESFGYSNYVVIAIYEKNQLTAVVPLIKDKKYLQKIYSVMPGDFVFGNPFLVDLTNKDILKTVVVKLLALGTINLTNIPREFIDQIDQLTKEISSSIQAKHYTLSIVNDGSEFVKIPGRNKLLKEIRGKEDNFVLQTYDGTDVKGLQIAFLIDNLSRKQHRGYNTFENKRIQSFYLSLGKHFTKKMLTHILYFDNIPIAYELGFAIGTTYFCSQKAYRVDYQQYSPGKVLKVKVLDYLGSKNISKMDFGSGDDHIKRTISDEQQDFYQVIISKNIITRQYLTTVGSLRNTLFHQMNKYKSFYTVYKKLRKLLVKRK